MIVGRLDVIQATGGHCNGERGTKETVKGNLRNSVFHNLRALAEVTDKGMNQVRHQTMTLELDEVQVYLAETETKRK